MRILSLEIQNIRGIKNIKLNPNGQNVVVYGPNGTGKSAIVDAVDFLLTGKISRLTGEGAKVLDIKQHGCHVDSRNDLKDTIVRAKVDVEGREVMLKRSIEKPSSLKVTPKEFKDQVKELLTVTELGQHILTRKEVLAYITAEAGKRAKKVMCLLNLDNIENLRGVLVTLKNEADTEYGNATASMEAAKGNILTLLSLDNFSEQVIMDKVNALRQTLDGQDVTALSIENMKKDLKPIPFKATSVFISADELGSTIKEVRKLCDARDKTAGKEAELRALLEEVKKDKFLARCMSYEALIRAGINLVDESNICPLCGKKWDGDFRAFLAEKEKETEIAKGKQKAINESALFINQQISLLKNYLLTCTNAHKQFGLKVFSPEELEGYLSELNSVQQTLSNPIENVASDIWSSSLTEKAFRSPLIEAKILVPLDEAITKLEPNSSAQQLAWDTLTKMEDRWRTYLECVKQKKISEAYKHKANTALEKFEAARNSVLESTYDAVQFDFEKDYKIIHGNDEAGFTSELSRNGAELNFEVDFYNRGKFPPQALHSEGHQDSMGLALFLALNAYLVKNAMDVIVLDDVVMSIDSGHRRGVCELLKAVQPTRQLIITTHDTAWAKQLKSQGIVKKDKMVHFANWNIATGPIYEIEKDLWDAIAEDLRKDELAVAAARLRRNAESFFDDVCDSLTAKIDYKGTHQWELGDYAPAAISAYKRYLKKARDNAHKIHDEEKEKALKKLQADSNETIARSLIEQWIVNDNVHYNRWETFSKADFVPMVAAYRELFSLFSCPECGSLITYNETKGKKPTASVSCACGNIFWNVSERFAPQS